MPHNFTELAIHYDMDADQAKALQLCGMWLDTARQIFPDYKHYKMSKKGDPRRSLLFKYCLKLVLETSNLIPDQEYQLYIRAQLVILKAITDGREHPLISPAILTGEKAWRRWRLWKKRYDAKAKVLDTQTAPAIAKVEEALETTKAFLFQHFQGQPTLEQFQEAADNKNLLRWIADKRLSPYYVANSLWISKLVQVPANFDICKTPEIAEIYGKIFPYEL